jgi:hypothetical protein
MSFKVKMKEISLKITQVYVSIKSKKTPSVHVLDSLLIMKNIMSSY